MVTTSATVLHFSVLLAVDSDGVPSKYGAPICGATEGPLDGVSVHSCDVSCRRCERLIHAALFRAFAPSDQRPGWLASVSAETELRGIRRAAEAGNGIRPTHPLPAFPRP